jgi:hypothetical protein
MNNLLFYLVIKNLQTKKNINNTILKYITNEFDPSIKII